MTIKNLSKFSIFFLFFFLFFPIPVIAQSPIQCGLLGEFCCNLAGSEPNSCKENVGLMCQNGRCVADGTTPNPPERTGAVNSNSLTEAFPKIGFPCDDTEDPEFHSLRPYQGAICGDADKASFCSNELKFIESFNVVGMGQGSTACKARGEDGTFDCNPNFTVDPHDLYVELTDSMFPILGNTEQVTNSQGGTEQFDDAQKVNEYVSWYLSGVNNKAEYGENTDKKVVDFSGPVQKLLPKLIQEAERIQTISNVKNTDTYFDEEEQKDVVGQPLNHDQIVVCGEEEGLGLLGDLLGIGTTKAIPCYDNDKYRLSDWNKDLSIFNGILNRVGTDIWNKRTPPLPWDDGTAEAGQEKIPFESQEKYMKAYNEWKGNACATIPLVDINVCIENPFVPNKWAELYQYIPLANTTDKGGVQRIVGVQFQESAGTVISGQFYDGPNQKSAPLSFAHTQEIKELSELLNSTYSPQGYESEKQSETTEKLKYDLNSGSGFACTAVNVRTNPGDNLFPGDRAEKDTREMIIPGITYHLDSVKCVEKVGTGIKCNDSTNSQRCIPRKPGVCCPDGSSLTCNAEVAIVIKTILRAPNLDDIFATTTADSGSTFRKIFPKVEEGAPVSCIADIPGVSGVTYTDAGSKSPNGGDVELSVKNYPEDGGGSGSELTFPHVGSIYEYFLNGIQTALRPKGYGEPLVNGDCKNNLKCGELPELPQAKGSCNLGGTSSRVGDIPQNLKDIVSAASETYKVPPNLILGVLFGEGVFNRSDKNEQYSKYDWTDENVIAWGSCEPLPNCTGPSTSLVSFVTDSNWNKVASKVAGDLKKLDPNKVNPDPCNLVDVIYVIAWDLHDSGDGGMDFQCFGLDLKSTIPSSCSWNDNQIISAIKVFENGYDRACFTKENSCATGGGNAARCGVGGGVNPDRCETITNRYSSQPSHMGCVFDVSKGK
jgi:hypothetical protein